MIPLVQYKDKRIAVYGLGRTGLSAIKGILASGGVVFAWDDSLDSVKSTEKLYTKCSFIHPREYDWNNIAELILSPGIPTTFPEPHWIVELARKRKCLIKSDIQMFLETSPFCLGDGGSGSSGKCSVSPKIVCVTGTNGKSTTTSLIGHVLNSCGIDTEIGGNIGLPVLEMSPHRKAYIIELSSYQIEITNSLSKVDAAVLLNLTPDHIDRHGNMNNYARVKERLILQSKLAVVGCDCDITKEMFENLTFKDKIAISGNSELKKGISVRGNTLYEHGSIVGLLNVKFNVLTNAENIASAFAVCRQVFRLDGIQILKAMESFEGLPHRNEVIKKIGNILFVNDSKSTNAASSEKTLLSWGNIYWILGGRSKEEGIEPLCKDRKRLANIRGAFLIGEASDRFASSLQGVVPTEKCENLRNAFEVATFKAALGQSEATVLLSPACASFDQWKNFEERGSAFRNMVLEFENQQKEQGSSVIHENNG